MGEILKSLGGMAPPLNCRPLAAGAGSFRVRVPAKAANVGEFTLIVRTDRFIKIITDRPPIERNDSPSETIARWSYVNVTMDEWRFRGIDGGGSSGLGGIGPLCARGNCR